MPTVYCVGRNYVEHCRELGNPVPDTPVFFLKSWDALRVGDGDLPAPRFILSRSELHYECEAAVLIGRELKNCTSRDEAFAAIQEVRAAIDVTARELQQAEKEKQLSWFLSKAFRNACPIAEKGVKIASPEECATLRLSLFKNGALVQSGCAEDMCFPIPRVLEYLSHIVTLHPGDVVLTGTPAGCGPLALGDRLHARLTVGGGRGTAADADPDRPDAVSALAVRVVEEGGE